MEIHDRALFRSACRGSVAFGEAYVEGLWSSSNVSGLLLAGTESATNRSIAERVLTTLSKSQPRDPPTTQEYSARVANIQATMIW